MNTTYSPDAITVRWDAANSTYCGGILHYVGMISSSDGYSRTVTINGVMGLITTFSNLRNDTKYNITITAVNRAGAGMMELINVTTSSPSVSPQNMTMNATNNPGM